MTQYTRRQAISLAATGGLVASAGCLSEYSVDGLTGDLADDASGELGDPAPEVEVDVLARPSPSFDPNVVHVQRGGTVRWVVDGHRHDVTAYHPDTYGPRRIPDGAEPWESGLLRGSREFDVTFDVDGIYDYADTRALCSTHEALGAVGRVVVGWPALEGQPAIEHDDSSLPGRASIVMSTIDEETRAVLGDD